MNTSTLEDLLLSREAVDESDTGVDIRNIEVPMFTDRPDRLIPGS